MIAVLVFPGIQILDATGPISAFEIAARLTRQRADIRIVAAKPGVVRSSSGVEILARNLPRRMPRTLIVAGGQGTADAITCKTTMAFLRRAGRSGVRIASVCSGAYLLAEAGLLDGRRATTHWNRTQHFRARYPRVKLEPDRIFTQDGGVWTSAGITAGIDLALAMIADESGETLARAVAQQLVMYHQRAGGQSQFSALLELKAPTGRFKPLLEWARARLEAPLTVERMAQEVAMSPRHFARAFAAETGVTPSKAVERLRIEVARERVETTAAPIEMIAQGVGFRDPERMRRAFIRAFGQPPQALRRAARLM